MSEWEDWLCFCHSSFAATTIEGFSQLWCSFLTAETEKKKKHSTSTQSKTCLMQAFTSPQGILQVTLEKFIGKNRYKSFWNKSNKICDKHSFVLKTLLISRFKVHVLWQKLICKKNLKKGFWGRFCHFKHHFDKTGKKSCSNEHLSTKRRA